MKLTENHEKTKNYIEKPWKPTENHKSLKKTIKQPWKAWEPTKNYEYYETILKTHRNQPKTMKTMKPTWKTVGTKQKPLKPWNYLE